MDRKPFPKRYKTVNAKDYGLEYDVSFSVWDDPGKAVVGDLLRIVFWTTDQELSEKTPDEQRRDAKRYFECVSEIIKESSIEGSCFDTPEDVEKTYELDSIPWGFWYEVVAGYCMTLINESKNLVKIRALLQKATSSGTDSADKTQSE